MEQATHSGRLERWIGKEKLEEISAGMAEWYGPPIAVNGVPGRVFAHKGGDFRGEIRAGWEMSAYDRAEDVVRRLKRAARVASARSRNQLNAGFTSLSDLLAEASGGKLQKLYLAKTGSTGVISATNSLWGVGPSPAIGANASAAPGGRIPTSATTGAMPFANAGGGDTLHLVSTNGTSTVSGMTLLMYDRIFDVAKTMNSTATEAVTGVPTRYTNATDGAADSAAGNFLFMECTTVLPATGHNWTVCTYTDQNNNAGATLPTVTGNSANIVNRIDGPAGFWFSPLATGDTGVKALTQMQCSALVATGTINFVMGHPLCWQPCPVANYVTIIDNINTAFNLVRVFDNACIAGLEVSKAATTGTTYNLEMTLVSG